MSSVPVPSCRACGLQSAGRCPSCHHELCIDHFPGQEHEPCATHMRQRAHEYTCYICGAPAEPRQWSSAVFAHYIDQHVCAGCKRPVCDEAHTRVVDEDLVIVRDGLRSHRYHVTRRYCDLCAPLRPLGGLLGATRWLVAVGGTLAAAALVYLQFAR